MQREKEKKVGKDTKPTNQIDIEDPIGKIPYRLVKPCWGHYCVSNG